MCRRKQPAKFDFPVFFRIKIVVIIMSLCPQDKTVLRKYAYCIKNASLYIISAFMPFCKEENAKFPSRFMTFLGTFTTVLAWSGQQLTGLDEFAAGICGDQSSFRSFSRIQPILRRKLHTSREITAGSTKLTSSSPIQSKAVMAALLPAAMSLIQPV